jgi:hypothetical protein
MIAEIKPAQSLSDALKSDFDSARADAARGLNNSLAHKDYAGLLMAEATLKGWIKAATEQPKRFGCEGRLDEVLEELNCKLKNVKDKTLPS